MFNQSSPIISSTTASYHHGFHFIRERLCRWRRVHLLFNVFHMHYCFNNANFGKTTKPVLILFGPFCDTQ